MNFNQDVLQLSQAHRELYSYLVLNGCSATVISPKAVVFDRGQENSVCLVDDFLPLVPQPIGKIADDKEVLKTVLNHLGYDNVDQSKKKKKKSEEFPQIAHLKRVYTTTLPQIVNTPEEKKALEEQGFDWFEPIEGTQLIKAYGDKNGFFMANWLANQPTIESLMMAGSPHFPPHATEQIKKIVKKLLKDFSPVPFIGAYFVYSEKNKNVTLLFPTFFITPFFFDSVQNENGDKKRLDEAYGNLIIERLS